jgi:hypothetical protein
MKKPLLYKIVDKAYHLADNNAPKFFQEHPKISAAVYGTVGTISILRGTQELTEHFLPIFYNSNFKTIEEICMASTIIGGISYVKNKFGSFKEMNKQYPVYTPGMTATWLASIGTAAYDILK